SGPQISTKKSYFPVQLAFKKHLAIAGREAAMNSDGRSSGNSGTLQCSLATRLEASNYAVKDNQIGNILGVAVIIAIHMREPLFLELTNQVSVKRNLEFRGQLDLV